MRSANWLRLYGGNGMYTCRTELSVVEGRSPIHRTGGMDPLLPFNQAHIDEQVTNYSCRQASAAAREEGDWSAKCHPVRLMTI